jgi:geranylgeranyl diphosphate synthase type I
MDAIGLPLGEAFQLRDDVLGVFGDPAVTGKPAGGDLREGKRTVLIARTLAGASEAGRNLIVSRLGAADLTDSDVDDLRAVIVESGALTSVESLIDDLYTTATARLANADLEEPGKTMLLNLAAASVDRAA